MAEIKAGVTLMTEFCKSHTDVFGKYIDYIDREKAQRNEYISKYNLYQNYMGNPEKTGGLFTDKSDLLSNPQKQQLKELFSTAQDNGSLMWQTVISFDNRWLKDNGLYDYNTGILDETKLKEVTRNAVRKMLKNEDLENAVWSAAIHYNTDNIHVHIATVEPIPQRRTKEYTYQHKDGTPYQRTEYVGRFKMKSIEAAKSSVVNQILQEQEQNKQINHIIRNSIIAQKKQILLSQDPQLSQQFKTIVSRLPIKKNLWNYNNNVIAKLRPEIDQLSDMYIAKYHADDMRQLKVALAIQEEKYRTAYGGSSYMERSYTDTKIKDLYIRLGNAILKEAQLFKEATQSPDDILNFFSDFQKAQDRDEIEQNIKEKLPEALTMLESMATAGNKCEAQYRLGKFYTNLESNYCNMEKGILFLEMAAAQGNVAAKYRAGKLYIDSTLSLYNLQKGLNYLEDMAPKNEYAKYLLGRKYLDDTFEGYNPDRGLRYLSELAHSGHDGAQTKLGIEYLKGIHVERDIDMAQKWLATAAVSGNVVATNILQDFKNNPHYSLPGKKISAIKASSALTKALQNIKRSMRKEFQKIQNERIHEQLQEQVIEDKR